MRASFGLLLLVLAPAAAAAQGAETVACRSPNEVYLNLDRLVSPADSQGWSTAPYLSAVAAEQLERAEFTRVNATQSLPDRILCIYRSGRGLMLIQTKSLPRGVCDATGWTLEQSDWATSIWSTSDLDKAKLTCKAASG